LIGIGEPDGVELSEGRAQVVRNGIGERLQFFINGLQVVIYFPQLDSPLLYFHIQLVARSAKSFLASFALGELVTERVLYILAFLDIG